MAVEYKIKAVSDKTRDFETKFGEMRSYKLKLEGVDEAVELAQKISTPAPQVGGTLFGTIDMSGQYGPRFKKERQFDGPSGGSGGRQYTPKDEKAIQAMWAIGQAANFLATSQGKSADPTDVEVLATDLFAMVDRVKGNSAEPEKDTVNNDVPEKTTLESVFGDVETIEVPDDF